MLNFKELKFKNFRSYGNKITILKFENGFDIFSAKNAQGKTSAIQALTFCLFGKVPKLKISELINNINNENLYTEVLFNKNKDVYRICRGEKPKIFEIYKNDEIIDQKSKSLDYQDMLEKEILCMNLQTFQMLVSLDTNLLNKSFITMSEYERREFLESILDIRVLYYIGQIVNTKLNVIKTQKTELEYKISSRKQILESEIKKLDDIVRINKDITENGNSLLVQKEERLKTLIDRIHLYETAFQKISDNKSKIIEYDELLTSSDSKLREQKVRFKQLEKELLKFEMIEKTAVICKSCGSKNTSEDISVETLVSYTEELETLRGSLKKEKQYNNEIVELKDKCKKIISEELRIKTNYNNLKQEIEEATAEVEKVKNFKLLPENNEDILRLQTEIDIFSNELEESNKNEDSLLKIKKLVSDDGVKKKIFEKYIPVFNIFLNEFLAEFNLNYNIIFDEKFKVSILDRSEERGYYTFSASERMRVNLAIMFSFLKLIETRKGFSINILIIDELLDNALDSVTNNLILNFLKYKIENKNKIIISHKSDLDMELFDRNFSIKKESGFSELLQVEVN